MAIANEIIHGAQPPKSFMEALIIPLRKKGDSDDVMGYGPIFLLQTGYKVIAKILATRMQQCLPHVIGSSQQGFVHGRQMQKTLSMMLAHLQRAREENALNADASRAIVLLDFRKAYNTIDRDFMIEALRLFGFDENFLALVQRLHTNTTARFSVNSKLSSLRKVRSGIQQGCPLAPLLFLVVVEVLAVAIQTLPHLHGLTLPGKHTQIHILGFVDDSTLFFQKASRLRPAMDGSSTAQTVAYLAFHRGSQQCW